MGDVKLWGIFDADLERKASGWRESCGVLCFWDGVSEILDVDLAVKA